MQKTCFNLSPLVPGGAFLVALGQAMRLRRGGLVFWVFGEIEQVCFVRMTHMTLSALTLSWILGSMESEMTTLVQKRCFRAHMISHAP